MKEVANLYESAKKVSRCVKKAGIFTGKEDLDSLIKLLLSPLGVEFCTEKNFPSLAEFRSFSSFQIEDKGVFVDKGTVELKNVEKVFLVGDTQATLYYDNLDFPYNVNLMHGASAKIVAKNGAVVFIYGNGQIEKKVKDLAKIYDNHRR